MELKTVTVEIAKLELGEKDTLVIMLKGKDVSYERAREFREHVYKVIGHDRFMIVDGNMVEFKIVKAPEDHVQD